ncbi:hypothetical protein N656DRAFT_596763 [Canariomyces notabilis]|uniref:Uncharacterized protein n=1 Tax=Canariomyces notabilis TaxID=2074819 RepID=A0AAN6TG37_9PEZI|nr:hypothetical protein N656DRAFT_596763 [Canariomyces arenarius]
MRRPRSVNPMEVRCRGECECCQSLNESADSAECRAPCKGTLRGQGRLFGARLAANQDPLASQGR